MLLDTLTYRFSGHSPSDASSYRDKSELSEWQACLLYTSDAADDLPCVDLGGRRIIKKKTIRNIILSTATRHINTYLIALC